MTKAYDASTEHRPFERTDAKGHPRPRKGQTAKRKMRLAGRRDEAKQAPAPVKKGKK